MRNVTSLSVMSKSNRRIIVGNATIAITTLLTAANFASATVYTWNTTSGSWQTAANWSSPGDAGGTPTTSGDTAQFTDTTADHTATYTGSGTTGAIGTISVTQGSAFSNILDFQLTGVSTVTVSNSLTLGAASGGSSVLYVNPVSAPSGTRLATIAAPSLTLNSGGILELTSYDKASAAAKSQFTGDVTINGGTFYSDRAWVDAAETATNSYENTINGAVTMISGTVSLGVHSLTTGNAKLLGGTAQSTVDRLIINGNLTVTGGTFSTLGSGNVLFLKGQDNSIQLSSGGIAASINLQAPTASGLTQTFFSDSPLSGGIQLRQLGTGANFAATVKMGAVTAGNTLSTGLITYQNKGIGGTQTLQLTSNITTSAVPNQTGNVNNTTDVLDLNGKALTVTDAAHLYGLSTSGTGGVWNLVNTNGSQAGTISAAGFDLHSPPGGASVGSNVNLVATGAGGFANNLGNTNGGTVNAASTFTYAGSASSATPDTLTSGRSIGNLTVAPVSTGTLQLASIISTGSAKTSVAAGGTLDLNTFALNTTDLSVNGSGVIKGNVGSSINITGMLDGTGTIGAAAGITAAGTVAPGGLGTVGALTIGLGSGALTLNATDTASFDIADASTFDKLTTTSAAINYGGALALNFAFAPVNGQTFVLFSGFGSEVGGFSSISSNLSSSSYTLSFAPATGTLTVAATPEPACLALFGMSALIGLHRRRAVSGRRGA
ncbi:MAG: hypothetical protein JWM57_2787 [Phycisphaerales bacterium]|nr:hypothetical protein [Phycisphaerales bacterium]